MRICAQFPSKTREGASNSHMSECRFMSVLPRLLPRARGIPGAVLATAAVLLLLSVPQADAGLSLAGLDGGFRRLYDLDFAGAQREFESWEKVNPDNPMGPVSEAAGVLFSEFDRLGVLDAQFYEDDSIFAALIEKRNLASLHYTKEATAWAQQLLAADPTCYDAHLASGVSRYIIGSMAAPVRWVLRLGGIAGDKAGGMAELQTTAAQGHLLAPFARILLAIAYVREKDLPRARELLLALQKDFPDNTLFGRELTRLDKNGSR